MNVRYLLLSVALAACAQGSASTAASSGSSPSPAVDAAAPGDWLARAAAAGRT
jgi:hypothetical protein